MLGETLTLPKARSLGAIFKNQNPKRGDEWFFFLVIVALVLWFLSGKAYGATTSIPGSDASDKLEAAGTLLRVVDSVLFSWGARIFAGICVMSAGWNLKEQRFGIAILCIVAAIVLGTAPMWVRNIFDIGGGGGIFSLLFIPGGASYA
jgi:hypothetical protein